MNQQFVKAQDIAKHLGVSKQWVYAQAASGNLPSIRIGQRIWFRPEAVEARLLELERQA